MENYLLREADSSLEELSSKLGFTKTHFLGRDLVLIQGTLKEILRKSQQAQAQKKIVACVVRSEEELHYVLEKTPVHIVLGVEKIHHSDSLHYLRGGLDQILCRLAAEKGKIIGFSFNSLLNAHDLGKTLARMKFNWQLCQKFGVKTIFSNFSVEKWEMRSAKDLSAWEKILAKKN